MPARHTVYVRNTGPYETVGEAWRRLGEVAGSKGLMVPGAETLGLSWDDPDVTEPSQLRYDASVVVPEAQSPSDDLGARTLPAGLWAVAVHRGPYETLGETYLPLLAQWLPRRRTEPADFPPVERYIFSGEKETEVQILVEEKQ